MKTAIVSGGSRGIGAAIVSALAKEGLNVIFTYEKNSDIAQQLAKTLQKTGGRATGYRVDQRNRDEIESFVNRVKTEFGDIHILVNNAAVAQKKGFEEITDEDWGRVMEINLRGPFIFCQNVIPQMVSNKWGRIVNISSIGGQWGGIEQVHYAMAKAGLINLTRSVAKIYSRYGITCNAVSPGLVNTDMVNRELSLSQNDPRIASIPLGRIATPDEIAQTVVFLTGEKSGYITGQTINVNGGMYFG